MEDSAVKENVAATYAWLNINAQPQLVRARAWAPPPPTHTALPGACAHGRARRDSCARTTRGTHQVEALEKQKKGCASHGAILAVNWPRRQAIVVAYIAMAYVVMALHTYTAYIVMAARQLSWLT